MSAMLVLSPVTLAMARVDMPDPLLVLLLVASGWATLRAVESGRTKHLVRAGGAAAAVVAGKPVVTIGGFTGWDPAPTTAQLASLVESGQQAHGTAVSGVSTSGGTLYAVHA